MLAIPQEDLSGQLDVKFTESSVATEQGFRLVLAGFMVFFANYAVLQLSVSLVVEVITRFHLQQAIADCCVVCLRFFASLLRSSAQLIRSRLSCFLLARFL